MTVPLMLAAGFVAAVMLTYIPLESITIFGADSYTVVMFAALLEVLLPTPMFVDIILAHRAGIRKRPSGGFASYVGTDQYLFRINHLEARLSQAGDKPTGYYCDPGHDWGWHCLQPGQY